MTRWYAVHTHPRAEAQAQDHLHRQGFATYLPCHARTVRHARRAKVTRAPLFPRYLFVGLDPEQGRWRAIASTVGVSHLLCAGGRPLEVPAAVLDALRTREDAGGLVVLDDPAPFRPGDRVEVATGPFDGQLGLVKGLTDDQRVVVLLGLLGRAVSVELPLDRVRPAA
jgi:transcriptional antiterminator RfaH